MLACHSYRLTPLYAFTLAFVAYVLPLVGSSPSWHSIKRTSEIICYRWWSHLFYVRNIVDTVPDFETNTNQMTKMSETWYLSCDMQMFWLSPLFIYPLWRWKKIGVVWVIICCLASLTASTFLYIADENIPATLSPLKM